MKRHCGLPRTQVPSRETDTNGKCSYAVAHRGAALELLVSGEPRARKCVGRRGREGELQPHVAQGVEGGAGAGRRCPGPPLCGLVSTADRGEGSPGRSDRGHRGAEIIHSANLVNMGHTAVSAKPAQRVTAGYPCHCYPQVNVFAQIRNRKASLACPLPARCPRRARTASLSPRPPRTGPERYESTDLDLVSVETAVPAAVDTDEAGRRPAGRASDRDRLPHVCKGFLNLNSRETTRLHRAQRTKRHLPGEDTQGEWAVRSRPPLTPGSQSKQSDPPRCVSRVRRKPTAERKQRHHQAADGPGCGAGQALS